MIMCAPARRVPKARLCAVARHFLEVIDEATRMLETERVSARDMSFQRFLDLRYEGQNFPSVPVSAEEIAVGALQTIRERFDTIHDRSFGHAAPNEPLDMVNIRFSARYPAEVKDAAGHLHEARRNHGRCGTSVWRTPTARGLPGLCTRHVECRRGNRRAGTDRGIWIDHGHVHRRSSGLPRPERSSSS